MNRRIAIVAGGVILGISVVAGATRLVAYVADNVGAPGPAATGSGACGSSDSVNITLEFADLHTEQACTRDRPTCSNQTVTDAQVGHSPTSVSEFSLDNQLRSTSRRYIFFMRAGTAFPTDMAQQTLPLDGRAGMPGQPQGAGVVLTITPRDPQEDGETSVSGTLTISSSRGVVHGEIDGSFTNGPPRADRPAPSAHWSPERITGSFTCNQ
ncbi:MAG TPA: hypothetical protein VGG90_04820 [Candidatus Dormibacteraeota bacterium]|jgi:hypothetical protein